MANKQTALTRRQVEEKITALAWKDDGFRRNFLADPKKQFEDRLGIKLPASLRMTAHAEDDNSLHFVIPAKPKNANELSDADLEKVAGGIDVVITVAMTALAAAAATLIAKGVNSVVEHETGGKGGWHT